MYIQVEFWIPDRISRKQIDEYVWRCNQLGYQCFGRRSFKPFAPIIDKYGDTADPTLFNF